MTSGSATRRGANSSSTRSRSPSLPPPRHFVGNLTLKHCQEGSQFRPWHYRQGCSVLHDHLNEELPRNLVALLQCRDLPGACYVGQKRRQPGPHLIVGISSLGRAASFFHLPADAMGPKDRSESMVNASLHRVPFGALGTRHAPILTLTLYQISPEDTGAQDTPSFLQQGRVFHALYERLLPGNWWAERQRVPDGIDGESPR